MECVSKETLKFKNNMNVYIDLIIFSLQKSGGISVYWFEFISRIMNHEGPNSSFIVDKYSNKNIFRKKLKLEQVNVYNNDSNSFKFLSRYREINLKIRGESFIFHSSYYRTLSKSVKRENNVKEIVTVHDFIYEHYSSGLKKWLHAYQKKKAIKAADVIICISENTKKDLIHFYPKFSNKDIRVIYNGVSENYYIINEPLANNKTKPYFLFVGSRAQYKNFDFVVKAVSLVDDYILKIVGSKLSKYELILLESNLFGRWQFEDNVDNIQLNILYNHAFALFYPSSYEGFGIPVLEAMKAGCPFIALNGSAITEVAGKAGYLMNNLCLNEFKIGVRLIKENRKELISLGLLQANLFSWDKCFTEILDIYIEINKKMAVNFNIIFLFYLFFV